MNRTATVIRPLNEALEASPPPEDERWFEMDLHPAFLNTPREQTPSAISTNALSDLGSPSLDSRNERSETQEPFQFDLKIGTFSLSLRADASLPSVPPWLVSSVRSTARMAGALVLLVVPRLRELLEEPQYRPARKPLRFRSEALLGVSVPPETANRAQKKSSGTR